VSDATILYDAVHARINAVLPSHKRLSDPYKFTKNTDSEKRQGYGVRVGPGRNPNQSISCFVVLDQTMTIVLTRLSEGREMDAAKKAVAEKQLLEDLFLIVKDFESSPTLGTTQVVSSNFDGHAGIEFIGTERDDVLKLEADFTFKYTENLN